MAGNNWIDSVTTFTINTDFDSAERILNRKIAESDSGIVPCFYLASTLNSKMTHFENFEHGQHFQELLDFIIKKTTNALQDTTLSDSLRSRLLFYRGSAFGYLAFYQGQNKQWFKALENGLKAVKNLQAALQLDSTLYEAYLGLGAYKYWRSTKLRFISWLPFVDDLREEGIQDIKKALKSSSNSRYMAMHQLVYVLCDYKKFDEALKYATEGIQRFPKSQFMWWAYAHVFYKSHQNRKAIKAYQHLLELINQDPKSTPSHWLACQMRLAELYDRLGEKETAKQIARKVLQQKEKFLQNELNKRRLQRLQKILKNS